MCIFCSLSKQLNLSLTNPKMKVKILTYIAKIYCNKKASLLQLAFNLLYVQYFVQEVF